MKLSLEQYLRHVDASIRPSLAGTLSEGKREEFWNIISEEKRRMDGHGKDFDCEFVLTPTDAMIAPFGLVLFDKFKVEGEEERKLRAEPWNWRALTQIFKQSWPFHKDVPKH
jgi:hypothetical protein